MPKRKPTQRRQRARRRRPLPPAGILNRIELVDDQAAQMAAHARAFRAQRSFSADRARALAAEIVTLAKVRYAETRNPLDVWRAYAECRSAKLLLPEWVLSYFDRVARRFFLWSMKGGARPPIDVSTAIAEALEMKRPGRSGRGNIFADFRLADSRDAALSIAVSDQLRKIGKRYLAVEAVAAEKGVGRSTVWRAVKKYPPEH